MQNRGGTQPIVKSSNPQTIEYVRPLIQYFQQIIKYAEPSGIYIHKFVKLNARNLHTWGKVS